MGCSRLCVRLGSFLTILFTTYAHSIASSPSNLHTPPHALALAHTPRPGLLWLALVFFSFPASFRPIYSSVIFYLPTYVLYTPPTYPFCSISLLFRFFCAMITTPPRSMLLAPFVSILPLPFPGFLSFFNCACAYSYTAYIKHAGDVSAWHAKSIVDIFLYARSRVYTNTLSNTSLLIDQLEPLCVQSVGGFLSAHSVNQWDL